MCCFPFQIEEDREKFNSKITSYFVVVVLIKCKTKEVLLRGERIQSRFFVAFASWSLSNWSLEFGSPGSKSSFVLWSNLQCTVHCDIYTVQNRQLLQNTHFADENNTIILQSFENKYWTLHKWKSSERRKTSRKTKKQKVKCLNSNKHEQF